MIFGGKITVNFLLKGYEVQQNQAYSNLDVINRLNLAPRNFLGQYILQNLGATDQKFRTASAHSMLIAR